MTFPNIVPSRRAFLLGGGAIAAVAAGGYALKPGMIKADSRFTFDTPLNIPAVDLGRVEGGVRVFDLDMQAGETEFFDGLKTATKGINGAYLGPVFRVRTGDVVRMNVRNTLASDTTLHWHGLNVPARADGGPHQVIRAGEVWSPEFEIRDQAATMWCHSHLMGHTAEQVWAGLAGLIVIDDDISDALAVPNEYGVDDIPLILQDRRFYRDGSMPYEVSMHDQMAGMTGNIPLVNGTILPFLSVSTQKIRLRLLNGANASIYHLEFEDGRAFHQIASDGGFLSEPAPMTRLRLAPGERAEIVVDFRAGQNALLKSVAANTGRGMGMMMGEQSPQFDLIEFRPSQDLKPSADVPARLAEMPVVLATDAVKTRHFLLEMGGMGMGMGRMMGGGSGFTINGQEMDMSRVDEVVKLGATEIWEIENAGPMAHPFHVHNTQFRVLDRDGRPPAAHEAGRKDTVLVDPGETVRILVRFDHYTDAERPYMYHCHILEHEDAGMMGQFTVV